MGRACAALVVLGTVGLSGSTLEAAELRDDCRYEGAVSTSSRAPVVSWLGRDGVFRPPLASPRLLRIGVSVQWADILEHSPGTDDTRQTALEGWVSAAGSFSIVSWRARDACDGIVVGADGGVHSQFDLRSPSKGLINADYSIGLPVSFRRGRWSGQLRFHHQSSHLGDEFLIGNPEVLRENFSFEQLELLLGVDVGYARVYAGGGAIVRSLPELDRGTLHWGVDAQGPPLIRLSTHGPALSLVGGVDFELFQLRAWSPGISAKAGLDMARPSVGHFRFLMTGYYGPAPFGQFLTTARIASFGLETHYVF